ncbi:hypothetical protein IT411_02590 [Candidatus Peregrinibacteria bacterium]|nr:hypothetical protein [Candidatus Peregrinibacteria bacterium]
MSKKDLEKNGVPVDIQLSAGDLEAANGNTVANLAEQERSILTESENRMEKASSRDELAKIADETLAKIAQLYGRSENDVTEFIGKVYKPAFEFARTLDFEITTKATQEAGFDEPADGFAFKLNNAEISSLEDKDRKNQATEIFLVAIGKIRVSKDLKENLEIANEAVQMLRVLYGKSPSFKHDFPRLEGQLYLAVKQRNLFLRNSGSWQQNHSSGI